MKRLLIGRSPLTTIAGYIVAILLTIRDLNAGGIQQWQDYILPVAIVLFGRLAADANSCPPPPAPFPPPAPPQPEDAPDSHPASFYRRGKEHSQQRSRDGRFSSAIT